MSSAPTRARGSHSAVISGAGTTRLGKLYPGSALPLMAAAAAEALDQAGLTLDDVDGLLTCSVRTEGWSSPVEAVAHYLGLKPSYLSTLDLAGASGAAMVQHAVMAIENGLATHVLVVAGQDLLTRTSSAGVVSQIALHGPIQQEFEVPHHPLVSTMYALVANRHMTKYGTTPDHLARVAVGIREHAARNPDAYKRDELVVDDVVNSPLITDPLHRLDCSIIADGAAAVLVSRADAMPGRLPGIHLLGAGYGMRHGWIGDADDPTITGAVDSGARAFAAAGLTPADIDVAELYDCFTITVLIELEDLGFCPKGEGGRYLEQHGIGLTSQLPVTTNGGLLSAGHPGVAGGLFHVVEGVRQLQKTAGEGQVDGAEVALVHGNGGVMATHCTLILGSEAA